MATAWQYRREKILDFGSGEGITANYFAKNNDVIAIEPSEEMLEMLDKMMQLEMKVAQIPEYRAIAFFHHLILRLKR